MENVKNKTVLVTGGSAGLGLAMGEKILEMGAKLLIIADINEQQGADAIKTLNSKYGDGKSVFYKCDVTLDLEVTFKQVIDTHEYVDVLINNAGVLNEKSIKKTINVNTIALMEWTVKFYEFMRKDKGGKGGTIVNVSSIYGFRVIQFNPYYNASKFAVIGFSKSIGHEYNFKRTGVRVTVLCPGLTHTNLANNPHAWDDDTVADLFVELENTEWQNPDAIANGIIEILEKAESGTVWLVEGSRPAVMI